VTCGKSNGNGSVRELLGMLRFSKKVIIFSFVSVVLFTAAMTVIIACGGGDPNVLITEFFSYFKIEGGILGLLKFVETIIDLLDKKYCGTRGSFDAAGIKKDEKK